MHTSVRVQAPLAYHSSILAGSHEHVQKAQIPNRPCHAIMCLRTLADIEDPDRTAESGQCLRCPLIETLDTTECTNGKSG